MGNQLIHAPVELSEIKTALDVGCGTGAVTNWLARECPTANVYGLDISPVPFNIERASNVQFLLGNVLSQSPSQWEVAGHAKALDDSASFDLVYSRLLICAMTDWPAYVKRAYELVRPGGWIEVHDLHWNWSDKNGKVISDDFAWLSAIRKAHTAKGLDYECGRKAHDWMTEAGFENVEQYV